MSQVLTQWMSRPVKPREDRHFTLPRITETSNISKYSNVPLHQTEWPAARLLDSAKHENKDKWWKLSDTAVGHLPWRTKRSDYPVFCDVRQYGRLGIQLLLWPNEVLVSVAAVANSIPFQWSRNCSSTGKSLHREDWPQTSQTPRRHCSGLLMRWVVGWPAGGREHTLTTILVTATAYTFCWNVT